MNQQDCVFFAVFSPWFENLGLQCSTGCATSLEGSEPTLGRDSGMEEKGDRNRVGVKWEEVGFVFAAFAAKRDIILCKIIDEFGDNPINPDFGC